MGYRNKFGDHQLVYGGEEQETGAIPKPVRIGSEACDAED